MSVGSAAPAVRRGVSRRTAGHRVRHRVAVGVLTALMAAGYSVFSLTLNRTFQTSTFDLVIFDQAVRSYAHLQPGISIAKGVHAGFGPDFSVLGDHWSPILASLAPLYWIHDGPGTLLVAQACLFALAVPPLWVFTRRAFGGGPKATAGPYLVSVAYALSWPIASAAAFDFHEVAFAPVLTAVALERLQAGRLRTALVALAVLLLVKEDMGLLVAGIGLYLAVARPAVVRRQRVAAAALIVAGVAATWIATYVLIPAFGGRPSHYWAYEALGRGVPQAVAHVIVHPLSSLRLLITPRVKLGTVLWLLAPSCFLALLSPLALAAIPLLLERMLATQFPNWWGTAYQYNAFLVIVLACAAVDGVARLDRWVTRARRPGSRPEAQASAGAGAGTGTGTGTGTRAETGTRAGEDRGAVSRGSVSRGSVSGGTVALIGATAICAVAVGLVPRFALGAARHRSFYQRDAAGRAAAAAVAAVPPGVTVEAANRLGPHLSGRDTDLLWNGTGGSPLYPPWVVATTRGPQFSFASVRQQEQRIALLRRHGYQTVFERDGYVVLRRPGQGTG